MNRTQTIAKLKSYADRIKALGATSLFLFGSTARNENNFDSDLDLFVDYDPTEKFNALDLVDIKLLLEDHLGMEVDVTTVTACIRCCGMISKKRQYAYSNDAQDWPPSMGCDVAREVPFL